jgi:hypothetical protein
MPFRKHRFVSRVHRSVDPRLILRIVESSVVNGSGDCLNYEFDLVRRRIELTRT